MIGAAWLIWLSFTVLNPGHDDGTHLTISMLLNKSFESEGACKAFGETEATLLEDNRGSGKKGKDKFAHVTYECTADGAKK